MRLPNGKVAASEKWLPTPDLQVDARWSHAPVVVPDPNGGGRICVFGGETSNENRKEGECLRYSINGTWNASGWQKIETASGTGMKSDTDVSGSVVIPGGAVICAVGGRPDLRSTQCIDLDSPETEREWQKNTRIPRLPVVRYGFGVHQMPVIGGRWLCLVGGHDGNTNHRSVYCHEFGSGTWETLQPMQRSRCVKPARGGSSGSNDGGGRACVGWVGGLVSFYGPQRCSAACCP